MISVVIIGKNSGPFLIRAIDSALAQVDQGDEVIFVDDHSGDGSYESVLKKYKDNSFVKVFKSTGQGISAARNFGNKKATNDFVYILDSDDYLRSGALSVVKGEMLKFPQIDVFYGDIFVSFRGKVIPYLSYPEFKNKKCAKRRIMAFPVVPFKHSAIIYRKEFINALGGYDEGLSSKIDIDLALRIVSQTDRIKKINSYLVVHQKHRDQFSSRRIRGMLQFKKIYWKHETSFLNRFCYLTLRAFSEFTKAILYFLKFI
jgi:glycosyltransferase involved in cell wall biosynthesis